MRILLWLTLGAAAATAGCVYAPQTVMEIPLWLVVLPVLAGCVLLCLFRKRMARAALVLLGAAIGFTSFRLSQTPVLKTALAWDNTQGQHRIVALDYGTNGRYGTTVPAEMTLNGRKIKLRLSCREFLEIQPGDVLDGEMLLQFTTPGSEKDSDYYRGKGIFLLARQRGEVTLIRPRKISARFLPQKFAHRTEKILERCFPKDTYPFVRALLLGDGSLLDYKTDTALKLSGIRHIIAISGLHVMILWGLIEKATGKRRYLTAMIGIPVLFFFAAMVGFTPSVTRASVMAGVMMLASVFDREYDTSSALCLACLGMMLGNPYTLLSVSFQLSVASVAGILLFQPKISAWWRKKREKLPKSKAVSRMWAVLGSSLGVSLSALVLTVPLSAWYFGSVSLVSPFTNLLVVWLIAPVFYGVLAVCALGSVWLSGGIWAAKLVSVPIRAILGLAGVFSRIPYGAVYTKSIYIVVWLAGCYCLLAAFLLVKKRGWIFWTAGIAGLAAALTLGWAVSKRDSVRFTALDVGQGQCLILQSEGFTYLIDCGGDGETIPADRACEMLLSQGVFRISGVILTHYDSDHVSGLENLQERMKIGCIYLPDAAPETQIPAVKPGIQVRKITNGMSVPIGRANLRLFQPETTGTENNLSAAVLFESSKCAILVTGDRDFQGEQTLLENVDLPRLDVLVAGHHGAKTSTSYGLLEKTMPRFVLISVGEGNIYGHPSLLTLERLELYGCRVYRTDEQGTIVYRR